MSFALTHGAAEMPPASKPGGAASLERHFRLRRTPFPSAADPDQLFMSRHHKEALAHLMYGLRADGGILLLTGDIGTGKTSICRCFLEELPEAVKAAHIARPAPDVHTLMVAVCRGFGLRVADDTPMRQLIELLNAFLLDHHARGRRAMLLIDDAQRLTPDVLEQLRLLTNLETHACKLLQIVLVGQTGLRDLLDRPELRQLSQRVVARYHLAPLGRDEVMPYVHHALRLAGGSAALMPRRLGWTLYGWTAGVPRSLNPLCERALQWAAQEERACVERRHVAKAAQDLGLTPAASPWPWNPSLAGVSLTLVIACAAAVTWAPQRDSSDVDIPSPEEVLATRGLPRAAEGAQKETVRPVVAPTLPSAGVAEPVATAASAVPSMASGEDSVAPKASTAAATGWPEEPLEAERRASIRAAAWTSLLQRWKVSQTAWHGCASVRPAGLQCQEGRAGLAELQALNLPAVLHLVDAQGRRSEALLQSVDQEAVLLRIGSEDRRVALRDLASRWRGDFTVLWRSPPAFSKPLQLGVSGPGVAWLRERLAQLPSGVLRPAARQTFDAQLQSRLREFQLQEHLDPDGIAGMKTLVRLAQKTDAEHPVLQ